MRQNSFQQKGLIEGMGFVFLIGLDGDYNYLKEILFWDPVSASWYDMSYTKTYTFTVQCMFYIRLSEEENFLQES